MNFLLSLYPAFTLCLQMVTEREDPWALCKQEKGWAIQPFQDSGAETAEILLQNSWLTSNWKFIVLLKTKLLVYGSQSACRLSDQWLSRPGKFSMAGKSLLMSVKWEHREISSWDEFHVCNQGTTPSQSTYSLPQHSELRGLDMCLWAIKRSTLLLCMDQTSTLP